MDSVDRSQITDEGIEKVMAVNDRYMTALMHAANADPGFNQINRGWGEAEGIKVLQNADRAESPRLRRLINEYYMDMTTAINQAVEAKKTEDALKAAQEAPQTPEQTQEVQQDQATAETAQEPEEKPKHEKPKWGAGRKQNPGRLERAFKPADTTPRELFDFGKSKSGESYTLPGKELKAIEDDYYDMQKYGVPEDQALQIANWFGREAAKKRAKNLASGDELDRGLSDMMGTYIPLWTMDETTVSDGDYGRYLEQHLGNLQDVLKNYLHERFMQSYGGYDDD